MSHRTSSERREYWQRLIREHRTSGLGVRAFCKANGLSEPLFYYWRRYSRATGTNSAQDSKSPRRARTAMPFVPVKIQPVTASGMIELVHRSGHVLRLPAAFDIESLAGILAVLDREGT